MKLVGVRVRFLVKEKAMCFSPCFDDTGNLRRNALSARIFVNKMRSGVTWVDKVLDKDKTEQW